MKSEQASWKEKNQVLLESPDGTKTTNLQFFKDCFPKWEYVLDGTACSSEEATKAVKQGVVWDVELKVEYGPKLQAYKLLKGKKK
jgi:hypothetical protein